MSKELHPSQQEYRRDEKERYGVTWREHKEARMKERRFVEEIASGRNVETAAVRAGYKPYTGKALLRRPSVGRKLLRKLREQKISSELMLELANRILTNDMVKATSRDANDRTLDRAQRAAIKVVEKFAPSDQESAAEKAAREDAATTRLEIAKRVLDGVPADRKKLTTTPEGSGEDDGRNPQA